jgi:hypothetical protein
MYKGKLVFTALILTMMLTSCIKRYDPNIKASDTVKYVVTGQVIRGDSVQLIHISLTTSLALQKNITISGSIVKIIDSKGNEYPGTDNFDGNYKVIIPEAELIPGNKFMLDIQVPAGNHIVSDFDELTDCPPVSVVYYEVESRATSNPAFPIVGVQFYADMDGGNFSVRRFRFEPVETWEYSANLFYLSWPPNHFCWLTTKPRNIYTLSTENLSENKYTRLPLHFVDNYTSQRLRYGYSLLLRMHSLSEAAWKYYEVLRVNGSDQGGLYENQPAQVRGNLRDLTHPEQEVLGFFSASSVTSKRIFLQNVVFVDDSNFDCIPAVWPAKDNPDCLDCMHVVGGTNVKPAFWPW